MVPWSLLPSRSLAPLALSALPLLFGACGSTSSDKTTGERITLHTVISTDPSFKTPFLNAFGWNITLSKAALSIGALYYFDGPPAFVHYTPRKLSPFDQFEKLIGIGIAYAHPGHYQAGDAVGQMIVPSSFDLFSAQPASLPDGEGITGTFRSGRFVFGQNPSGPAAAELSGHAAIVQGVAAKSDGSLGPIYFILNADFADIAKDASQAQVDGCDFQETAVQSDGTVNLSVLPTVWMNLVDFTAVAPGTPEQPTLVDSKDKARIGFILGLAQLSAYKFSFSK